MTDEDKWEWSLGRCKDRREERGRLPPAPPPPLRSIPASGPIAVGFWSPVYSRIGGTETWHRTLFKYLDPELISVRGLAVSDGRQIAGAEDFVSFGKAALGRLASESEIIVAWGLNCPGEFLSHIPPIHRPHIVMVCHGDDRAKWSGSVMRSASADVDHYVAVSDVAVEPIPPDRRADTTVIFNGIDYGRLVRRVGRDRQREIWGVPADASILGYLGRLSAEKRPGVIAEALKHLPDHYHAVLIGDGAEASHVIKAVPAAIRSRLHLPGPTSDIGSALGALDYLISPSDTEGFGLSIVEAWAAGVPVVATGVGVAKAHPDLVQPIPVGCTALQVAGAVLADEQHIEDARQRAQDARRTARALYSAPRWACDWQAFLVVLAGRDPRAATAGAARGVVTAGPGKR